jgi:hypothetical protein
MRCGRKVRIGAMTTTGDERVAYRIDVVSTVLLALATVATAWAGYQSARWHGEQAAAQARATAARVEATRSSGVANRQDEIDVALFIQWVDARALGDTQLEEFYRRRFRDEFRPAFQAWIAAKPLTNPGAPLTPFAMPEYELAATRQVERLEAKAEAAAEDAGEDIERADRYVLAVVLFASSLFFAGISTRLRTQWGEAAILGLGCVLFLGTVAWIATFPVSVAI